jgi:pimeloyl-ACP methyl ester carboxylesterase
MRQKLMSTLALATLASTGLGGCATDIPVATVEQRYSSPASQFITLSDGVRLHMRDEGPRDAPVIFLAHGSNASLHTWEPWVQALSGKWRVISFDFPAHGLTGPSASQDYSTTAYVRVVDELATHLGVQRFVLAGNSMGGGVAWRYALSHPERVAGLVLVDASGYPSPTGKPPLVFRLARAPVIGEAFSRLANRGLMEANIKEVMVDDTLVTPKMVDRYYDLLMRKGNRQATLIRLRTHPDAPKAYQNIKNINASTLIIWGKDDPWIPVTDAAKFAGDIKGATTFILDNTGHLPQEEKPSETAAAVDDFMAKVYPPQ